MVGWGPSRPSRAPLTGVKDHLEHLGAIPPLFCNNKIKHRLHFLLTIVKHLLLARNILDEVEEIAPLWTSPCTTKPIAPLYSTTNQKFREPPHLAPPNLVVHRCHANVYLVYVIKTNNHLFFLKHRVPPSSTTNWCSPVSCYAPPRKNPLPSFVVVAPEVTRRMPYFLCFSTPKIE